MKRGFPALVGITAPEVEAVKQEKRRREEESPDSNLDQIAGVLYGWHTDSDFTGPYGIPLELPIRQPNNLDFNELVSRYVGKVAVEPLLEELISIGAVVETEKGWYRALIRHFIPEPAAPEGLDHLARSVEDFVTTLDFNRNETDPKKKLFERQVYTEEGIHPADLERFKRFAGEKAQLLLEEIDNWISQLDTPKTTESVRLNTGMGIYHYIHETDPDEGITQKPSKDQ